MPAFQYDVAPDADRRRRPPSAATRALTAMRHITCPHDCIVIRCSYEVLDEFEEDDMGTTTRIALLLVTTACVLVASAWWRLRSTPPEYLP